MKSTAKEKSAPASCALLLQGETVNVTIHRLRRSRHLTLRVNDDAEAVVRIPLRCSVREALEFVERSAPWLLTQLKAARSRLEARRSLTEGDRLPLLDEQLCLRLYNADRHKVLRAGDELHVHGDCHERGALMKLLEGWYRNQAKVYMTNRLTEFGARLGLQAKSLSIRNQKTLWGSCSAQGAITMNWRLMLAPAAVVDYVLAHELCHVRHLNHSTQFWNLVERIIPDYRARRALLRQLQPALYL
ncbi:MAG: SprT family zinc-dependent metalloprotease [Pseudomonadota bacterium]